MVLKGDGTAQSYLYVDDNYLRNKSVIQMYTTTTQDDYDLWFGTEINKL